MTDRISTVETPVLIAGGGPIGLALAADLGRRGVAAMLVERNANKLGPAKMLEVSVRTMELCRQLGIAEKVRNWGFPLDWPLDSAFVTDLAGYEIGRVRTPALGVATDSLFSPERGRPCPQTGAVGGAGDRASAGGRATRHDRRRRRAGNVAHVHRSTACVRAIWSVASASPASCASCSASPFAASRILTGR